MKDYMGIGMLTPIASQIKLQGQEKDPETGKEAFELRLWDSRIGRWLTTDPYGQYDSPYLGMGNDPINGIDPDGGCYIKNEDGTYSKCPDAEVGSTRTGAFGYNWTFTKSKGWQVTNGASNDNTKYYYDPIIADGTAAYYVKRYASHLKRYNRRPPDYYLSYGHKYINRFKNQTRPKLTGAGKKWLDKTAVALQLLMNRGLQNSEGSIAKENDEFTTFAYNTHVPAYVGSGLLNLGVKDKLTIGATPDFNDLMTFDGLKQASDVWILQQLKWIGLFPDFNNSSKPKSNCGCPN